MASVVPITLTGTEVSVPVEIKGKTVIGIGMPTEWQTSDIYAEVQLQSGAKWRELHDEFNDRVAIPCESDVYIQVDPKLFALFSTVRFSSAQEQTSPRTLDLYVADFSELRQAGIIV